MWTRYKNRIHNGFVVRRSRRNNGGQHRDNNGGTRALDARRMRWCGGALSHAPHGRTGRAMSWWTHRETALDMQLSHTFILPWICSYIPTFCIPIFRNLRFRLRGNYNRLASQAISSTEEPSLVRISWLVKANVLFYFEFQCKFYSILQTTGLYYRTAKLEVRGFSLH